MLLEFQNIRSLQCHKSLWLYRNRPYLRQALDEAILWVESN
jgi:hypothetical protein